MAAHDHLQLDGVKGESADSTGRAELNEISIRKLADLHGGAFGIDVLACEEDCYWSSTEVWFWPLR